MNRVALKAKPIKGIKCIFREGFSDLKTFEEVIGRGCYEKKFAIEKGETWLDLGGNVGAFTLLACSKGANVVVYEPDPYNCEMIRRNLDANGFSAEIIQAAVTDTKIKKTKLYVGENNNVWRNSIVRKGIKKKSILVDCVEFDKIATNFDCVKMDIEGSEMPILEKTSLTFKKLAYEWSFDIDRSLTRFWCVIDRQKQQYDEVHFPVASTHYEKREYSRWQANWSPACANVYCRKK